MVIVFIALVAYSLLAGIVEGILYGRKAAYSFKMNEHAFFFCKQISVLIVASVPWSMRWLDRVELDLAWIFIHSFVHDAGYYETRARIDMPEYHWLYDYSKTSTARFEINVKNRIILGIAGLLFLALHPFNKYLLSLLQSIKDLF